jgi:pyruvate/2-oxoglutarate dehydrogenase complex dihydrolipoamide acyltransferase (E2) component
MTTQNPEQPASSTPIVAPDLDLDGVPMVVSAWLARLGARVLEGDRVVELTAGDVTIDVSSPTEGALTEIAVKEDEPVTPGQVLGVISPDR